MNDKGSKEGTKAKRFISAHKIRHDFILYITYGTLYECILITKAVIKIYNSINKPLLMEWSVLNTHQEEY